MPMNIIIRLPDASQRPYSQAVTVSQVAMDISPRLEKAAIAAELDGRLVDLSTLVPEGEHDLKILTDRDPRSLEIVRHTAAHVLAQAMVRLFGKEVQYAIGPALMDDFQYGFYYDFDLPSPLKQEDLPRIEEEMRRIVGEKLPLERIELPVDKAVAEMNALGQGYKVEMIQDLVREQNAQSVSLYRQGEFLDMCRGPHLADTGRLKAFKLLVVAGAYWRGDETKKMLTRIYGTAFLDEKTLAEHLNRVEEAKKRDHRVLGRQLGLFLLSDCVGPGLPLWMPRGATVRRELENWLREELLRRNYQLVYTPHIGKLDMYRTSGHYPYYKDSQFPPILMEDGGDCAKACNCGQEEGYLLKPMNCPHHIQIYKAAQHSYRDLPLRLAEFGTVYRMEQSGELNGLTRVRGFTQDDAHIFCSPEQVESEIESCVALVKMVLEVLELRDYHVRVSLRDPASDKYVGDARNWEMAENNIRTVVRKLNMNFVEAIGEAAFYGPKIDFLVKDCIGREWQLGTIQVDYNLPERFGLEYAGADNVPHRPVMIHRAPFGALERFIGILIEHFAGAFPMWLAPVQAAVLPVSDKFNEYAAAVDAKLRDAGIRVELDNSSDKIGAKIRRATLDKIPYMLVVGQREAEGNTVAVRHRTTGDLGAMSLEDFLARSQEEIRTRGQSQAVAKKQG